VAWMRWWLWWGCAFTNTRRERGLGAKNHETEHSGSISGVPCETAAEGNGGRRWHDVDEVGVVVGRRIRQRGAGEGVGAKIPKPSTVARFRAHRETAAAEGDGGRRGHDMDEVGVVVGQRVR
jgi:hypothetical protein